MNDLSSSAEIADVLPGRLTFAAVKSYALFKRSKQAAQCVCFSIDDDLVYEPFAADFGPLNVGATYRFCQRTTDMLQIAANKRRAVLFFCGPSSEAKANAAVLIGAFQVLVLGKSALAAYHCIQHMEPFEHFKDASSGPACFGLTVRSCIEGLAQARGQGLLDFNSFDFADYDFHEKVENGDSTWIVPGKLLAFSGPAAVAETFYGYRTKTPEDYWSYFQQKGVSAVVRLNRPLYKSSRFTSGGFRHYELYFPDGSCPSEAIVDRFLSIAESEQGALAIHCKAGLGRTGVLICCYMMKHMGFTAREALGYIRVCRPGSVIGPQQNYIMQQEARMHAMSPKLLKVSWLSPTPSQQPMVPTTPPPQRPASSQGNSKSAKPDQLRPSFQIHASCHSGNPTPQPTPANSPAVVAAIDMGKLDLEEPKAPSTPSPSCGSRLSSFLRFKTPSKSLAATSQKLNGWTSRSGGGGVARAVAPNGQPRKIPAAILAAGESGLRAYTADEDQPDSAKSDQWTIHSSSEGDKAEAGFVSSAGHGER